MFYSMQAFLILLLVGLLAADVSSYIIGKQQIIVEGVLVSRMFDHARTPLCTL